MTEVLTVRESRAGAEFLVRARPRSGADAVREVRDDALVVAVTAPPADGAANASLIAVLAAFFGQPRSRVEIVSGAASRTKRVRIAGADAATIRRRIARLGEEHRR